MRITKKLKSILLNTTTLVVIASFFFSYSMALAVVGTLWPSETGPSDVVVSNATDSQWTPLLLPYSDGNFFAIWGDNRTPGNPNLYAQKLSRTNGSALWSELQVTDHSGATEYFQTYNSIAVDGSDNVFLAYSNYSSEFYIQKISPSGSLQWGSGIYVFNGDFIVTAPDETGGLYVAWRASNNIAYIKHFDSTGGTESSWNTGNSGAPVTIPNGGGTTDLPLKIMRDSGGNIIIINNSPPDIYAMKIDANGTFAASPWDGSLLIASGNAAHAISDGSDGLFVVYKNASQEIIAQHIDDTGSALWSSGVTVATADTNIGDPVRLVSDGAGGIIVAWEYSGSLTTQIYVQHVLNTGTVDSSWDGPILVNSDASLPASNQEGIIPDGNGGAYITFATNTVGTTSTIGFEHILSDGTFEFLKGSLIMGESSTAEDTNPTLSYGDSSGAAVIWSGQNVGGSDIYAQFFDNVSPSFIPNAPTNLTAIGGNNRITLNWYGTSGATSYNLYSSTVNGGPYSSFPGSDGITAFSFIDTSVTAGTTHYYVVRAANENGESDDSTQANATVLADTDSDGTPDITDNCPAVPNPGQENTDFTIGPPITWDFTVNGTTDTIEPGVTIFRRETSNPTPFNGTNIFFDAADADTTYNNGIGCITPCSAATFATTVNRIGGDAIMCGFTSGVPTSLTAYDQTVCARSQSGHIYELDFKKYYWPSNSQCVEEGSNDPWTTVDCAGTGSTYTRNSFIGADMIGDVCDCATDGFCTASAYCISNGTPDVDCAIPPEAIDDLLATPSGNGRATLTWTIPNDNGSTITGFNIAYGLLGNGFNLGDTITPAEACTGTNLGDTCSYDIIGLTNFSTYEFRVSSININGVSNASNIQQLTPSPCGALESNNQITDSPLTVSNQTCMVAYITAGSIMLERIPASFNFPLKFSSSGIQNSYSNDNPATPPVDVTTSPDDIITVSDMRNAGTFRVTITASSMSNGVNLIPLNNLYTVSSYPDIDDFGAPINDPTLRGTQASGVEWAAGAIGPQVISTPTFNVLNLNLPSTYTAHGASFDADSNGTPDIITLMETAAGHMARMSQALNFYLKIPGNQAPGTYSTVFTLDLLAL